MSVAKRVNTNLKYRFTQKRMSRRRPLNASEPPTTPPDVSPNHMHLHSGLRKARDIDFHSVALYLPAVQVVLALLLCCATVLTLASTSADCRSAAPRGATLSAIVSLICVFRPIRVQEVHGMDLIFDTIRPAVVAYWIALICEQLVYTGCASAVAQEAGGAAAFTNTTTAHRIVYHLLILLATGAGFLRAYNPMSKQDVPFLISTLALIIIALFPPTPLDTVGPLCHVDGIWDAAERLARALLFGLVFCALAYASEPTRHSVGEITLCASRATAASAWILGVHPFVLPLAFAQGILAILRRIHSEPIYDAASDISERHSTFAIQGFQGGQSDEEGGLSYEMSDEGDFPPVDDAYDDRYVSHSSHTYPVAHPAAHPAANSTQHVHPALSQPGGPLQHVVEPNCHGRLVVQNKTPSIRFDGMIDDSISHTDSNASSNASSGESVHLNSGPGGAFSQIPSKQRMEEIAASVVE